MSFIERFGLGALFVLCGLILIVGLFGEDDVAAKTRKADTARGGGGARAGFGLHEPAPGRVGGQEAGHRQEWNNLRPIPAKSSSLGSSLGSSKGSSKGKIQPKVAKGSTGSVKGTQRGRSRAPKARRWKVRRGDSLARIAQRCYGRQGPKVLRFLARANGMKVRDILKLGRVLEVPALPPSLGGPSRREASGKVQ